ncbi:MAG: ribosome biogenesis GTP-binding protein YihA/YsxC [Calditrichia bacterium]
MLKIKNSRFIKSIVDYRQRPEPSLTEFAFAGRSNVGKSSFINGILNRKNLAKVSKQPGKTRTINYFIVNESFYFVDLPGYGYARVSSTEKAQWGPMIEKYLVNSSSLKLLFILMDSLVGPQNNDLELLEWVLHHQIPFKIIMTKRDRITNNMKAQRDKQLRQILSAVMNPDIIYFSAKTREGLSHVLQEIEKNLDS